MPEHYIISSGLREIIEGTPIAPEFKEIYAASFCYDEDGVPIWPAMAVNYTSKTQFLFRINKGVPDVTENRGLNEYMPEDLRRVPFRNMIYIGDGLTDVPCMKLTKVNGGHFIAVYQTDRGEADDMIRHGRVDYVVPADYSKGSELEQAVFEVVDQVAAMAKTARRHMAHYDAACGNASGSARLTAIGFGTEHRHGPTAPEGLHRPLSGGKAETRFRSDKFAFRENRLDQNPCGG